METYGSADIKLEIINPREYNVGKPFTNTTTATLIKDTEEVLLDSYTYDSFVLCSWDPNDKQVSPAGRENDHHTLVGETLNYHIRFQNTGNAVAYDVRILDTLDHNLDLSTFSVIGSSHDMTTTLNRNVVEFLFKNIYLPDSISNEPMSHGYVTYKIDPLSDVTENTLITNTADIYFDANPPIRTNTTQNVLVDSLRTTHVVDQNDYFGTLTLFPNPISRGQRLNISSTQKTTAFLTIIDKLGSKIKTARLEKGSTAISTEDLAPGIYFCVLESDNYLNTYKIVVAE